MLLLCSSVSVWPCYAIYLRILADNQSLIKGADVIRERLRVHNYYDLGVH